MTWLTNRYTLVARVYPALLAIAPVIWTAVLLFPESLSDLRKGAISVIAIGGVLYLLASLARYQGKRIEPELLKRWNGWPTTVLLRHCDHTIDPHTKARYHARLCELCDGLKLPTPDEERTAPVNADCAYRSATTRLIEARRGPAYRMLQDENASYGFRRNLLGLKPFAIGLALMAALVTVLVGAMIVKSPVSIVSIVDTIRDHPDLSALLVADLIYAATFAFMVSTHFVAQSAQEYALALFRTLELS